MCYAKQSGVVRSREDSADALMSLDTQSGEIKPSCADKDVILTGIPAWIVLPLSFQR